MTPAPIVTPSRRSTPSPRPWAILGTIGLIVLVEAGVTRHRGDWATPTARCMAWSHQASVERAATADVVVLGDSVLKFGFAPLAFEAVTKRRADNWATTGNPPAVALSMLRAHLQAGGRPRLILVDFKPFLLAHGVSPEADAWAPIATVGDIVGLAGRSQAPGLMLEVGLPRVFPSIRDRKAIRGRILGLLAGQGTDPLDRERPLAAARERNWGINRGGWLLPPLPSAATTAEFPNEAANLRLDWQCLPGNAATIAAFFRLAAAHDIPVVWLITPIHPRLQAGRDQRGIDDQFTAFVRDARDHAAGTVRVVDARRLGLAADRFVDATHLDRRGALAFTRALGAWFEQRQGTPPTAPWTILEPIPPSLADAWSDDPTAEDTDGSARILAGQTHQVASARANRLTPHRGAGVQ